MKHTNQTINHYREKVLFEIAKASEGENMRVHISKGNKKIGSVYNISLPPIFSCGNCAECKNYCYAIRTCLYSPDALKAWAENWALYKKDMVKYFDQIKAFLILNNGGFFRWHVGGDIPSAGYFRCMVDIAEKFPLWRFWCYTKQYNIVNHWKELPKNLVVMYSKWNGVECPNPYGRPEFRTKLKGMSGKEFDGLYKCPGACQVCIANMRGCIAGETTYNDEH